MTNPDSERIETDLSMNPGAANKQCEPSNPIDIDPKCACRAKYPVSLHALGYWSMVWRDCKDFRAIDTVTFPRESFLFWS